MNYKDLAISLAQKAGEIMRQNFQAGMKMEWKSDNSPVTIADLAINKLVIDEITKNFPNHNVKGEEQDNIHTNSEYLWVCDPVDGTIPFSHGLPISTFSLALVKNGESILGVIYDPFMDRLFYAEKGKGSYLNDQPIHTSGHDQIKQSLINIESFETAVYQMWPINKSLAFQGSKTMRLASIIYPSALIAQGEVTACIFPHNTAHDVAAVKIIVEEAGGKVTDLFGNEQRYDQPLKGAIISNGKIHDLLIKEVALALASN